MLLSFLSAPLLFSKGAARGTGLHLGMGIAPSPTMDSLFVAVFRFANAVVVVAVVIVDVVAALGGTSGIVT